MIQDKINFDTQSKNENIKFVSVFSEKVRRSQVSYKIGSDEHLDFISERTTALNKLIDVLEDINNMVETGFPTDKVKAKSVLQQLHVVHSATVLIIDSTKAIDYKNCFKTVLKNLVDEKEQLIEYIDDINNFVLSDEQNLLFDID